mmetsp:Transcript_14951/g.51707  ORF Transcript_14951/g.51707 Transcript_14951/m.51707 type:complete len:98 (+) Transcript_14951:996-1289(+)
MDRWRHLSVGQIRPIECHKQGNEVAFSNFSLILNIKFELASQGRHQVADANDVGALHVRHGSKTFFLLIGNVKVFSEGFDSTFTLNTVLNLFLTNMR